MWWKSRDAEVLAGTIGEAKVNVALLQPLKVLRARGSRVARIEGSPELLITERSGNCVVFVHVARSCDDYCSRRAVVSAVKGA